MRVDVFSFANEAGATKHPTKREVDQSAGTTGALSPDRYHFPIPHTCKFVATAGRKRDYFRIILGSGKNCHKRDVSERLLPRLGEFDFIRETAKSSNIFCFGAKNNHFGDNDSGKFISPKSEPFGNQPSSVFH